MGYIPYKLLWITRPHHRLLRLQRPSSHWICRHVTWGHDGWIHLSDGGGVTRLQLLHQLPLSYLIHALLLLLLLLEGLRALAVLRRRRGRVVGGKRWIKGLVWAAAIWHTLHI